MFREFGPDARELLEIVAFFPQVSTRNTSIGYFRPSPDVPIKLDKSCILSPTYRANGFVTMLVPLRDYLRPNDPTSSSLLSAIKAHYFTRFSGDVSPDTPDFEEARWIMSEDDNVEYLLDAFATIDTDSEGVWEATQLKG